MGTFAYTYISEGTYQLHITEYISAPNSTYKYIIYITKKPNIAIYNIYRTMYLFNNSNLQNLITLSNHLLQSKKVGAGGGNNNIYI